MATEDRTGNPIDFHIGARGVTKLQKELNFADNPCGASDVIQALNIPAGCYVHKVIAEVEAAEGSAGTFTVGDGSNASGFLAAGDINATGFQDTSLTLTEGVPNTVTGYTAGKLYSAADTIDFVPSIALDAAKVRIVALVSQV